MATVLAPPTLDIPSAVITASHWVVEARPVIIAYLALEQAAETLGGADRPAHDTAARIIETAAGELHAEIAAVRDAAIERLVPNAPQPGSTEADWEAYEAVRDALRRVISVDDAIAAIDREPVL